MAAADHFREANGLLQRWETPWDSFEATVAIAVAEQDEQIEPVTVKWEPEDGIETTPGQFILNPFRWALRSAALTATMIAILSGHTDPAALTVCAGLLGLPSLMNDKRPS